MIKKAPKDMTAPNPFTDDQLAWMREEQRSGYNCAAKDKNGFAFCYGGIAHKQGEFWTSGTGKVHGSGATFICKYLSWDDDEPLCFADYAPLPEGEEHED